MKTTANNLEFNLVGVFFHRDVGIAILKLLFVYCRTQRINKHVGNVGSRHYLSQMINVNITGPKITSCASRYNARRRHRIISVAFLPRMPNLNLVMWKQLKKAKEIKQMYHNLLACRLDKSVY